MPITKNRKRVISLFMAVSMTFMLAGCGSTAGVDGSGGNNGAGVQAQGTDPASENGQTAMGRYVEKEIDLSDKAPDPVYMQKLENGSIVILDQSYGAVVSWDQGASWIMDTPEWFSKMRSQYFFIGTMAMTPDGTTAVVYDSSPGDDDYTPIAKLILPGGTEIPVQIDLTEEDRYIRQVVATQDGRIFARTFESIYEIYMDGSGEKVLAPGNPSWFWVLDNLLFVECYSKGGTTLAIYDMDTKEYADGGVIEDFVNETYSERNYDVDSAGTIQLMPGEDGTVYIAGSKGIHRHALGGNMVEQIVDGNLSLLGNPNYGIISMLQPGDDIFLVLCSDGKLLRLTYDPNVPSVPTNTLTVYSLRENDEIKQAVSYYQTLYPDWYVSYRIGMSDTDSVTREDAVKKLNTEIMAGNGPDLIVMDDLPLRSYADKGLLLDLTDYLTEYNMKEPLFDNITDAMKIDGKAYIAPAVVSAPMIATKETYAANMTSLSGIADTLEKMREDHPGENLTGMISADEVMKMFIEISAPSWTKTDGTLNMDTVMTYLEQCRRIYDAQTGGLDAEVLEKYTELNKRLASYEGVASLADQGWLFRVEDYLTGGQHILICRNDDTEDLCQMLSLKKERGYEGTQVIPMQEQDSRVFMPKSMLAINAASEQIGAAKGFMDVFLSVDVQSGYDGYPLNRAAFDMLFPSDETKMGPGRERGTIIITSEEGIQFTYDYSWPTDDEIAIYKEQIAALNTAYISDSVLEEAVFGNGIDYINGQQTLEETLDKIEKAAAIYMAE